MRQSVLGLVQLSQPIIIIAMIGATYVVIQLNARAVARATSPSNLDKSSHAGSHARRRRDACFAGGLVATLICFTGPIEQNATQLFWVHMTQHVILLTVAAPLLALSAPWHFAPRLLKPETRRQLLRSWRKTTHGRGGKVFVLLSGPAAIWIFFNVNLLVFHIPILYNATLSNVWMHELEHMLFIGLGVWFWAQVLDPRQVHARLSDVERCCYVLAAAGVGWGLAIVLTFAPRALYSEYANMGSRPGGISALMDQQIAAGIMLVPGSITFLLVAGVALMRWFNTEDQTSAPLVTASIEGNQQ